MGVLKKVGRIVLVLVAAAAVPGLCFDIAREVRRHVIWSLPDSRASLPPLAAEMEKSVAVLAEEHLARVAYRSFIGWRREAYQGRYTSIGGRYNTRKSELERLDGATLFFGGSTVWGSGASDLETIPSHYAKIKREPVTNFGEASWTSRQSLNELVNVLGDGVRPARVVFFDGVNDVLAQCRVEHSRVPSHSRERQIGESLKPGSAFIAPYLWLAQALRPGSNLLSAFDCHSDRAKASAVAKHLIESWRVAAEISRSRGFEFIAILQPTAWTSTSRRDYLVLEEAYEKQYDAVYPSVIEEIAKACGPGSHDALCPGFVDGRSWLDYPGESLFIDYCHVNGRGNQYLAERIVRLADGRTRGESPATGASAAETARRSR